MDEVFGAGMADTKDFKVHSHWFWANLAHGTSADDLRAFDAGLDKANDIVRAAIRRLQEKLDDAPEETSELDLLAAATMSNTRKGYAFVAMSIDHTRPELDDRLDAIKEAAGRCDIEAERIDEVQSNERITDRMLASIRVAEHVIVGAMRDFG